VPSDGSGRLGAPAGPAAGGGSAIYAWPMATRPGERPKVDSGEAANGAAKDAVDERLHRDIAPVVGPDDERVITDSGIEIKPLYEEEDVAPGLGERLGEPGSYPFTRGIHERMYRDRLWTMRQYAGFASPEDTNERYRYLTEHGSTGLSMAFDLPTQLGRDSDDPLCAGEVGRTGVPIDTLEDMRICFEGISLADVSTSMTINAPAAILLLLYELVGEEQGVPAAELRGTVQNDVLKEYISRGNYIYPPEPTMRLTTDIFAYCDQSVPKWNTISIRGYHIREKGCSAVQEVAFTLANAIAYVEGGIAAGLDVNRFGQRLAFFFNGHNNVFQEIAKFRAVRRMWAKIMRERFEATEEKAQMIRFHTQTGGVTLQAQQPEVNIIRVALQGFAAVAGGTQSLHTNGFDEALALPTERSARIALRTQQVLAYESGVADTVDPFAGSYFVESLTDEIEERSWELMDKVAELGGSVAALEFMQREIEESAHSYHERYRSGQDVIVGVNKFVTDQVDDVDILKVDPESERRQLERLKRWKANRDQAAVDARLTELRAAAEGDANLLPPIKEALRAGASIGEACGAMRDVFGEYRGGAFF
jgi:methylmalonyl-CoA mutase N-terminal domain/subunit